MTETTATDYGSRLDAVVAHYWVDLNDQGSVIDYTNSAHRYVLVERSDHDRSIFLTTHAEPGDAASYHDGQDEPDNWHVVHLIDLENGDRMYPELTTEFFRPPADRPSKFDFTESEDE